MTNLPALLALEVVVASSVVVIVVGPSVGPSVASTVN